MPACVPNRLIKSCSARWLKPNCGTVRRSMETVSDVYEPSVGSSMSLFLCLLTTSVRYSKPTSATAWSRWALPLVQTI